MEWDDLEEPSRRPDSPWPGRGLEDQRVPETLRSVSSASTSWPPPQRPFETLGRSEHPAPTEPLLPLLRSELSASSDAWSDASGTSESPETSRSPTPSGNGNANADDDFFTMLRQNLKIPLVEDVALQPFSNVIGQLAAKSFRTFCGLPKSNSQRRLEASKWLKIRYADPNVIDLFILCFYNESSHDDKHSDNPLPPTCPLEIDDYRATVRELPSLTELRSHFWDDFSAHEAFGGRFHPLFSDEAVALLSWIVRDFTQWLSSISPAYHKAFRFPLLSSRQHRKDKVRPCAFFVTKQPEDKERVFQQWASKKNSRRIAVYCGIHPHDLPDVLQYGLKSKYPA
jgi:hypothetical protein